MPLSTTLHVPPSTATGSYYVLAKADWDGAVNESTETNNVRASGAVKIGPDLVMSVISAPPTAVAGSTIDVSDTTKNQGGGTAAASTTRFYWSANTSIDASDQVIGSRIVRAARRRRVGQLHDRRDGAGDAAAGTYYVIAQADAAGASAGNDREQQHAGQVRRSRWDPT